MEKKKLVADWERVKIIFSKPDSQEAHDTMFKYMQQIFSNLHKFLQQNVGITKEISLKKLTNKFKNENISENPEKVLSDEIKYIILKIAPRAVNISSPYFIGHMASAIPFFMVPLKIIVTALNQNLVKLETSKIFSLIERETIAKIHKIIYNQKKDFYNKNIQNSNRALGTFTEGGTIANITALWVARNNLFRTKDANLIEEVGLAKVYNENGIENLFVLISERGHYSLRKAGGLLGIGNQNIIPIKTNKKEEICLKNLKSTIKRILKNKKNKIMAIVGIAGATETGTIDPLAKMAKIAKENNIYFHVDAAWGGPVLLSETYKHLLDGIEQADSVTIDGHKQFYMPIGCGMVLFKDPKIMDNIIYHANYVNRKSSVDLGMRTLSGSREANSLVLHSSLKIMGSKGYALLIENGIRLAKEFAKEIKKRDNFELFNKAPLNILTYRVFPLSIKAKVKNLKLTKKINNNLNALNISLQRKQREAGKSFVSRTTLKKDDLEIVVLRVVLMNPMTTKKILNEILNEQEEITNKLKTKFFKDIK